MEHFYENKILSLIAFFVKNTKNCGKTKLAKLLFYVDWGHLKKTGKTITGLTYNAFKFGPFPKELYNDLKDKNTYIGSQVNFVDDDKITKSIVVKFKYEPKYFSKFELSEMAKTAEIFKDASADDMVRVSHWINEPWTVTKNKSGLLAPIDEKLAFDKKDSTITVEEYLERKKERGEFANVTYA